MFWLGLLVGNLMGMVAMFIWAYWFGTKLVENEITHGRTELAQLTGMSKEELSEELDETKRMMEEKD